MRHPRNRRPIRSHRWEGYVSDLGPDTFTAILHAVDHDFPDTAADFDRKHLPDVCEGLRITLYTHRRGRKVRVVLRAKRLEPLTAEQIAASEAWAAEMAKTWCRDEPVGGRPW